jgi:vacuolar protein sorting-associated protein VTA1
MEPPILPDDLRHIKPFLDRAAELSTRDPAVSYYCKYYAAQLAIGQQKRSKEATVWLGRLLDELEQLKRNPPPNAQEAISSETVGSAHVENFALKVFLSADNEDRAGKATK